MTTPTSVSDVINARRTESLDAPSILTLVQPLTEQLFGKVNVVNLIEKAVLAVTLSNEHNEVLGHAAFFDYPNLDCVDEADWETWLKKHYPVNNCSPLNTLFLHYFVAKPEYSHGAAKEIIRTAFNAVPDLHFIYLIVPKNTYPESGESETFDISNSALADMFSQLNNRANVKGPDNCVVFACHRHSHVPVLHVRDAKVQDHDDLTPIFNRQSDMLTNTYGDFFLAELIEAQDDNMHCLVAEFDGTAIGFMSICRDVNVALLNECFELGPFHGLRKPCDADELTAPKVPTPPPQANVEETRPESGKSNTSPKPDEAAEEEKEPEDGTAAPEQAASPVGANAEPSVPASETEVKTKPKLSDANMGQSSSSILSASTVEGSVKSVTCQVPAAKSGTSSRHSSMSRKARPDLPVLPKASDRFRPVFKGPSDCFSIQLFCIDEKYEMRSMDFLRHAFELFPDKSYAVITVPHLVPEFPLLQKFVRVTPRVPSTLPHELYIYNKSGLLMDFKVRRACTTDYAAIEKLVQTVDLYENLLADLTKFNTARRDDDGTEIQAFVAECVHQIVGVCVIRQEEDIEFVRSHYNIEDFIYFNHHKREEHGHLHHFAMNPIFGHLSKHFLKEVLRIGHKTCLYYPVYPPYSSKKSLSQHSMVTCLNELVPVRARRQIVYPTEKLSINAPSDRVLKENEPYALCHINRKLTLEPKVVINARIVVVGASDTGVSFLETLAFCPHLRFNNMFLISPHGLPGELTPESRQDNMTGKSHCYSVEESAQVALRTWTNVIYGKMTGIDRHKKHVVVNYSHVVPYDHLILTTGQQYQIPCPTDADINCNVTNSTLANSPDRWFTGQPPSNLFVVNDTFDAAVCLNWVENQVNQGGLLQSGTLIVYGNTLDAYCSVEVLRSVLPSSQIVFVQPPVEEISCFNNPDVEDAMCSSLKELGIEVYTGYLLAQWNDGQSGDTIQCVTFTSDAKPLRLQCSAFVSFYKKKVDFEAFKAVNDACLVFDGRLVIDAMFHTNDVSIRGAGPLTKFQRKYHADQWSHANFNSKEVGIQLASTMLTLFDPTLEPEPEAPQDMLKLIPMYRAPKIQGGILPGGYHYLNVSKPALSIPLNVHMAQNEYGRELITGKPGQNPEFFRLHINQYRCVETITALAKKGIPSSNLICLYNLHERYLNNLLSRVDEGLVTDLYSFLEETWALAIFHDRFPDFREEVRELLVTRPAANQEALEEKIRTMIEEDLTLNGPQRKSLATDYANSQVKRAVETRLLSFLSYNYYHLPFYAKPGMV